MVESCLSDKELLYDTIDGPRKKKITAGTVLGSLLGHDVWNVSYDGICDGHFADWIC